MSDRGKFLIGFVIGVPAGAVACMWLGIFNPAIFIGMIVSLALCWFFMPDRTPPTKEG